METQIIIGKEFVDKVIPIIEKATTSIKVIVYDWRLYPNDPSHPVSRLVLALKGAVERNVDVQVLLSNDAVRQQLSAFGFDCKRLYSDKLVHAKMMLIDDRYAIIGSHNYTQNAFQMNLELSVALDLFTPENELRDYFNNIWPL